MLTVLLTISVLHWAVLLIPGANFFLIGQLAASGKRSTACAAALGITTVTLAWASLAILGIGIVFNAHPLLRQIFQITGGAYLAHVAYKLWRSPVATNEVRSMELKKWTAFRLGFMTNVLNPKTALFFGSVFATVLPANPSFVFVVCAVLLVYANAMIWHLFLALAFSMPRMQSVYAQHRQALNKLSGIILGYFGARLIAATLQELRLRITAW